MTSQHANGITGVARLPRKAGIAVGFAVVASVGLAACSSTASTGTSGTASSSGAAGTTAHLKSGQPFKLGVSLTLNNTDFWTSYISYEAKFAKQYNAQLIGPVVAAGDAGKQITDIHTLIAEGAQALIVNPVDSAAIAPALAFAQSKGIPVVSVDVAPTAGHVFSIVRANNMLYGQESCKYIGEHVKSGSVAQLQGDLASLNGRDRSTAFSACMKKNFPALKVINYPTKWDSAKATNAASTALSSVSDLKAIYTQWSAPIDGILQAEKSTNHFAPVGDPKHIVLVSNDGVPFELKDIRAGIMDATISQPADQYAQYSVLDARQALEGKTYKAGDSTGHDSGAFVTVFGNLEDPIKAPLVTKANASDPKLWGNQAGK